MKTKLASLHFGVQGFSVHTGIFHGLTMEQSLWLRLGTLSSIEMYFSGQHLNPVEGFLHNWDLLKMSIMSNY